MNLFTNETFSSFKLPILMRFTKRLDLISSLTFAGGAIPQHSFNYNDNLRRVTPIFVAKGDDWIDWFQKYTHDAAINSPQEWGGTLQEFPHKTMQSLARKLLGNFEEVGLIQASLILKNRLQKHQCSNFMRE